MVTWHVKSQRDFTGDRAKSLVRNPAEAKRYRFFAQMRAKFLVSVACMNCRGIIIFYKLPKLKPIYRYLLCSQTLKSQLSLYRASKTKNNALTV